MDAGPVTVINTYEMPGTAVPRFLADWRTDRAFLNAQAGFTDGTLYQAVYDNARFRFISVSRWQTTQALEGGYAALRRHHAAHGFYRIAVWRALGVTVNRALYREAARY